MSGERLPRRVLLHVLGRSFLLQASWSFERMMSLGALYAMAPALRRLYRGEELIDAYRRHLEYFNTHPFMASPVLGTTLALEEVASQGGEPGIGVREFRGMVTGPYAAMGDAFFWGGVRPFAAVIALFFAAWGSFWAPAIFLALFNLPHLSLRALGLFRGYRLGLGVVERIQRRRLPDLAIRLKEVTVVLLGALCAYLTFLRLETEEVFAGWGLVAIPLVLLGGFLARKGVSTLVLVLSVSALVLICFRFSP